MLDLDRLTGLWAKIGTLPTDEYSPDPELEEVVAAVPDLIAELRASRKVVEAAERLIRNWVDYDRLVELGDSQAVALRDALVNVRNEGEQ